MITQLVPLFQALENSDFKIYDTVPKNKMSEWMLFQCKMIFSTVTCDKYYSIPSVSNLIECCISHAKIVKLYNFCGFVHQILKFLLVLIIKMFHVMSYSWWQMETNLWFTLPCLINWRYSKSCWLWKFSIHAYSLGVIIPVFYPNKVFLFLVVYFFTGIYF